MKVPLVWAPQGAPTAAGATYSARLAASLTVTFTRTGQVDAYTIRAPDCTLDYRGAVGAFVYLDVVTKRSVDDPKIPTIALVGSSHADAELYLKTRERNDVADLFEKLNGSLRLPERRAPMVRTRSPVNWTRSGPVGTGRFWEGTVEDLLGKHAWVRSERGLPDGVQRYSLGTTGCLAHFGGAGLFTLTVEDPFGAVSIDRTVGPDTEFFVHRARSLGELVGDGPYKSRRPGEASESTWTMHDMAATRRNLSPGVLWTDRSFIISHQEKNDAVAVHTPSCQVVQGTSDGQTLTVYDRMTDIKLNVLQPTAGARERRVTMEVPQVSPAPVPASKNKVSSPAKAKPVGVQPARE